MEDVKEVPHLQVPGHQSDFGVEEHKSTVFEHDVENIDLNDPTLEKFPSDRAGIMDAVRKVETSLNEDQTLFEGVPPSPVVGPLGRREGIVDDPFDEVAASSPSLSPTLSRRSGSRLSQGSFGSDRPSLSLDAIAEEPKEPKQDPKPVQPVVSVPSPVLQLAAEVAQTPTSDEDEGVAMPPKNTEANAINGDKKLAVATELPTIKETETSNGLAPEDTMPAAPASPRIVIQPPEPEDEPEILNNLLKEPVKEPVDGLAKDRGTSTARDSFSSADLTKRTATPVERAETPISMHHHGGKGGSWLSAFLRLLFVDLIGGLLGRLFGGNRKA
jgi:hypothetical protein